MKQVIDSDAEEHKHTHNHTIFHLFRSSSNKEHIEPHV